ncbi:MAG: hypothetical protein ACYC9O_16055 [Candidatus Latescibacterota bacterium]
MEKLIPLLFFLFSIFFGTNCTVFAQVTDFPVPRWTVRDLIPPGSDVSFLQTGSFGAGEYPYRSAVPPVFYETRLNGLFLPAFSPFGPNLESLPILFMDSLAVDNHRVIHIASIDSIPEFPVTRIGFLSGERRKFRFQGTFHRKVTGRSAVFVGGSADGIRGNQLIQGNASRLYSVKYLYSLGKGGLVKAEVNGGRDRSDIYDLSAGQKMGNGRIDNVNFSAGLDRYPLSDSTLFSSALYYRNGASQFRRFGTGSSFDDDSFGAAAHLTARRGRLLYTLDVLNDTRLFDDRSGETEWDDNITGVYGSGAWELSQVRLSLGGGAQYSTRYGFGVSADGEIGFPAPRGAMAIVRGVFAHRFPGPGELFYSSLTYSDTLRSSRLDRYHFSELEAGVRNRWRTVEYGVFGFAALADTPYFVPVPASMEMTGDERYAGGRITLGISGSRSVAYSADARLEYTGGSSPRAIWPRPVFQAQARGNLSRLFFHGNLHAAVFGQTRLEHRTSAPLSPEGSHFFLDAGISAKVGAIVLYYQVENITDTNMSWFGAYEVQGRNSLWGVRWNLTN